MSCEQRRSFLRNNKCTLYRSRSDKFPEPGTRSVETQHRFKNFYPVRSPNGISFRCHRGCRGTSIFVDVRQTEVDDKKNLEVTLWLSGPTSNDHTFSGSMEMKLLYDCHEHASVNVTKERSFISPSVLSCCGLHEHHPNSKSPCHRRRALTTVVYDNIACDCILLEDGSLATDKLVIDIDLRF